QSPLIAPSMLKCDFGNLHREVELLESAGAELLHLDVMDGHFVPNLSYGPVVIERLREVTQLPFDAHLMISDPAKYLDDYIAAGCDAVTFHIEAVPEPADLLQRIREAGALAGLALNPGTPLAAIEQVLPECDLVLVMSVQPGFGGQAFQPDVLDKVRELHGLIGDQTLISIDGGIGPATISRCAAAGVDLYVAGSAIFDAADYRAAIEEMRALAAAAA
ncbi:MAG: ribulose-phosphate 3-epimerase, partial [Planctomycetaceae bacterium]|nr:ribulose-phosphate 3-epimerase [Planctomycetaceae bacterium]